MNKGGRSIFAVLVLAGVFALAGCGGDDTSSGTGGGLLTTGGGGGGSGGAGGPPPGAITTPPPSLGAGCGQSGTDLICITLNSTAGAVPADGTSTSVITATLTRNGAAVSSQIVDFTLSSPALGTLTAANGVTSAAGTVTTTFQAAGTIGAVGVTATHAGSGASNSLAIGLTQAPASTPGGIEFISAIPSVIGVVGSGQATTSAVTFNVTDANGGPVPGQIVSFTMTGPVGAYVGASDGTPTTATGTTNSAGNVSVPINAGSAAGTVTLTANVTVNGVAFTTSTSVISIGGAVPSAHHFTIATARFNLPGLVRAGFQTTISVFLADRFSNFNILAGTQVSFFTEAGAIDTSVNLDETGFGTVTIRTQDPMPVTIPSFLPTFATPDNPRSGHLKVIAVARGEEGFFDVNGNGLYDPGIDIFNPTMDQSEPFVDENENGVREPSEQFVDANANGQFDGPNGVWDGPGCTQPGCNQNPTIWQSIKLMFTGHVLCSTTLMDNFDLQANGPETFTVRVHDQNFNVPVPGTVLSVSAVGATVGGTAQPVLDGVFDTFFERQFVISDPDPATVTDVTVTIAVTTPAGEVATCASIIRRGRS